MTYYDRLAERARPAALVEEATSYYSKPEETLDPKLFTANNVVHPTVRTRILSTVTSFLGRDYRDVERWLKVYIAGSGASFQWAAARQPGDLDILLGVDFIQFRQSNDDFLDLSDQEIASHLNEHLRTGLWPQTSAWEF